MKRDAPGEANARRVVDVVDFFFQVVSFFLRNAVVATALGDSSLGDSSHPRRLVFSNDSCFVACSFP